MRRMFGAPALLALLLGSCGEPPPPAPPPDVRDVVTPSADDPMLQVPAGGYADWLAEIREGVQFAHAQAAGDRGVALNALRQLYEGRFEYLQQFYGEGGSLHAGEGMATAVEQLGHELQALIQQLTSDEVGQDQIQQRVQATEAAIQQVETEAQAAGVQNTPVR